jgi:hypothetical protein
MIRIAEKQGKVTKKSGNIGIGKQTRIAFVLTFGW